MNILNDPPAPPRDQRVYPTRTADRCSDCPPAGYPTEKTRCYGCPLANTYKDATGELVIPTAAPSSKTDLEFVLTALRHALGGMRAVQEHAPQGTAAARYANELEQAIGIIERMRQDETSAPSCHATIDAAWREFLQNTSSDRSTWEAFNYAWLTRGDLDPTFAQLETQCQAIWRSNVTLVCRLPKGHSGNHGCGRHTWTGEVDAKASSPEEPSAGNHAPACAAHDGKRCNCGIGSSENGAGDV